MRLTIRAAIALTLALGIPMAGCSGTTPPPQPPKSFCPEGTVKTDTRGKLAGTSIDGERSCTLEGVAPLKPGVLEPWRRIEVATRSIVNVGANQLSSPKIRGHGPYEVFRADGSLKLKGQFSNGMPDGVWRRYDRARTELGSFELVDGTGKFVEWLDDGTVWTRGELEKNQRTGRWETGHADSEFHTVAVYSGDRHHVIRKTRSGVKVAEIMRRLGTRRIERSLVWTDTGRFQSGTCYVDRSKNWQTNDESVASNRRCPDDRPATQ